MAPRPAQRQTLWSGWARALARRLLKSVPRYARLFALTTARRRCILCRTGRANIWPIWLGWPASACTPWASRTSMAMTAALVGVRPAMRHAFFRTAATTPLWAPAGALPSASGAVDISGASGGWASAKAARSAMALAYRARLRPGVPKINTTIDKGSSPYNTKVITAPSTVPMLLVASATAAMRTT